MSVCIPIFSSFNTPISNKKVFIEHSILDAIFFHFCNFIYDDYERVDLLNNLFDLDKVMITYHHINEEKFYLVLRIGEFFQIDRYCKTVEIQKIHHYNEDLKTIIRKYYDNYISLLIPTLLESMDASMDS